MNRGLVLASIVLVALVALVAVAFSAQALAATPTPTCKDSDGGKNYDVKGTTTGISAVTGVMLTATDGCATSGAYAGTLAERYCSNNKVVTTTYKCPNGCSNGACLKKPAPKRYLSVFTPGGAPVGSSILLGAIPLYTTIKVTRLMFCASNGVFAAGDIASVISSDSDIAIVARSSDVLEVDNNPSCAVSESGLSFITVGSETKPTLLFVKGTGWTRNANIIVEYEDA